jgi:hypothetical protein
MSSCAARRSQEPVLQAEACFRPPRRPRSRRPTRAIAIQAQRLAADAPRPGRRLRRGKVPTARCDRGGRAADHTSSVTTFEYPAHAACIVPLALWPALGIRTGASSPRVGGPAVDPRAADEVRARLAQRGALTISDLGGGAPTSCRPPCWRTSSTTRPACACSSPRRSRRWGWRRTTNEGLARFALRTDALLPPRIVVSIILVSVTMRVSLAAFRRSGRWSR